jgi:hypothetical protein
MADKVIISKSKLVALGDVIREKTGSSEKMTIDVMTETMRNHSGGGSSPQTMPEVLKSFPLNNPDNSDMYYGKPVDGLKKIIINLPKLAEVMAKALGFNNAEEYLSNTVRIYDSGYRSPSIEVFSDSYSMLNILDPDESFGGKHRFDLVFGIAYIDYSENENGVEIQYGCAIKHPWEDKYMTGVEFVEGKTEYEYVQELGIVELDVSMLYDVSEINANISSPWEYVIIQVILSGIGAATDNRNGDYIHLNLNDVETCDWLELVF